jgi:hypothetical protein
LFSAGIGVLVAISAAAVIWIVDNNTGGTGSPRASASSTTIAPTVPLPVAITAPSLQKITLQPATGLHDGEVIHIVANGYTPGVQYYSMECKADSYVAGDCNTAEFEMATADASGTVKLDYQVLKGPFGANHIICSGAHPCMIGVAGGAGNNERAASTNLDFR